MKLRWISSVCVLTALLIGPAGTGFCLIGSEIAQLKQAGLSADVLKAIVVSSSEKSSDAERERAYGLLKEMGVVIVL